MRAAVTGLLAAILGFAAGWLLRGPPSALVDVPPSAGDVTSARATELTPEHTTPPRLPPPSSSDDELAKARQEASLWHGMYDQMAVEAYGEPIPFPPDLPDEATEAGFRRVLAQALAECAPDAPAPVVDCSEYPCRAMVRDVDKQLFQAMTSCPSWAAYGGAVTASLDMDCDDGRKEGVIALIMERPHGPVTRDDAFRNTMKRSMLRSDQMAESWTCAPPP